VSLTTWILIPLVVGRAMIVLGEIADTLGERSARPSIRRHGS
jgi:hypothetical protein